MEKQMAPFFRRLQVNFMEVWDDEGKVVIYSMSWKKPLVPQQQGSTECAYYMMLNLLSTSRCGGKA
jgi:hypothetical protein